MNNAGLVKLIWFVCCAGWAASIFLTTNAARASSLAAHAATTAGPPLWNARYARSWAGATCKGHPSSSSQRCARPTAAARWNRRTWSACGRHGTAGAGAWSNAGPGSETSLQVSAECAQPAAGTPRSSAHAAARAGATDHPHTCEYSHFLKQ